MSVSQEAAPAPPLETDEDVLRVENIVKRFGSVVALDGTTLHLRRGEVLGLIGDNGAGKSTLIKIITGFHRPDGGRIVVEGRDVQLRSVPQARALGIETVYQDLALVDSLSVFHNMFLGKELRLAGSPLVANRSMKERARRYLEDMKVNVTSVDVEVGLLSGGQRQAIAIARAVYSNVKILLLDEPLAAMGAREAKQILDLIRRLKERREVSMIIISHTYAQIMDVCDRVDLLRRGRIVFDKRVEDTSLEELTELVVSEYRGGEEPPG